MCAGLGIILIGGAINSTDYVNGYHTDASNIVGQGYTVLQELYLCSV